MCFLAAPLRILWVAYLGAEGRANPFHPHIACPRRDCHDVEACGITSQVASREQEMFGCGNDSTLFVPGDRGSGATKLAISAVADFDECKCAAIEHDEVDFAAAAAVVALDEFQFPRCQIT